MAVLALSRARWPRVSVVDRDVRSGCGVWVTRIRYAACVSTSVSCQSAIVVEKGSERNRLTAEAAHWVAPNLLLVNRILLTNARRCPQQALRIGEIIDAGELPPESRSRRANAAATGSSSS